MIQSIAMDRPQAGAKHKIRIEKPEVNVYSGSIARTVAEPKLGNFPQMLLLLSFLFSAAAITLVVLAQAL